MKISHSNPCILVSHLTFCKIDSNSTKTRISSLDVRG